MKGSDMRINDDHMYHGAALTQIAEHPTFKAINAFWQKGKKSSCAFRINDSTGIYIKYAGAPHGTAKEYVFTFTKPQLEELSVLREQCVKVFVTLVCIKVKEICVISYGQLQHLIQGRRRELGTDEDQYQVLVTALPNKQFRAYINCPARRGIILGEPLLVQRKAFPEILFAEE
jgi:hypothetical protein